MKSLVGLACALLAGPSLADCPRPIPDDLGEAIEAAKAETRSRKLKRERLEPKLEALTPQELAHYVTDLAKGRSPSGYEQAMALAFEIAADRGSAALLRHAIDYDGDGYSVVRILAHDIDNQDLVRKVLGTFAPEGAGSAIGIKLLSDVDDTIYANLVDPRFEKTDTRYPGVEALYRAIAEEPGNVGSGFGDLPLVTLSARPDIRKLDLVKRSLDGVSKKFAGRICAMSLGGELVSSGLGTIFTLVNQARLPRKKAFNKARRLAAEGDREDVGFLEQQETRIGKVKFDNYRRFTLIYPSYDYVFFGDSGQADAHAARLIMDHNPELASPGAAIITFIHDLRVAGDAGNQRGMSPARAVSDALQRDDVVLFRNHVEAALIAFRRGRAGSIRPLVDAEELVAVVEQALVEVQTATFKSPETAATYRAGLARHAAEAVAEARAAGARNLSDGVVELVIRSCSESRADCPAF